MRLRSSVVVLAAALALGLAGGAALGEWQQPSSTVGNLAPAAHWQLQTAEDCAEMSAAAIIGTLTGHTPSEAEITAAAGLIGGYDPAVGTEMSTLTPLFMSYGLVAAVEPSLTWGQVTTLLQHGYRLQAVVNGQTLWHDSGLRTDIAPTTVMDHAVVLDSIDQTRGLVHLTDSALKGGADEVVTSAQFASAWQGTVVVVSK